MKYKRNVIASLYIISVAVTQTCRYATPNELNNYFVSVQREKVSLDSQTLPTISTMKNYTPHKNHAK